MTDRLSYGQVVPQRHQQAPVGVYGKRSAFGRWLREVVCLHDGGCDTEIVAVVRAGVLDVAYERYGDLEGWPVVLLHGFPYDPRCFDDVTGPLVAAGADVVVPYLRGYGPTRFADATAVRSGQQAALAHDLADLLDALRLEQPIVAGFDWGGRAACLVAALWPDLVSGLVTVNGYNVQNIGHATHPLPPEHEANLW